MKYVNSITTACLPTQYGPDCRHECSHTGCLNDHCDPVNGFCIDGCTNYYGPFCRSSKYRYHSIFALFLYDRTRHLGHALLWISPWWPSGLQHLRCMKFTGHIPDIMILNPCHVQFWVLTSKSNLNPKILQVTFQVTTQSVRVLSANTARILSVMEMEDHPTTNVLRTGEETYAKVRII